MASSGCLFPARITSASGAGHTNSGHAPVLGKATNSFVGGPFYVLLDALSADLYRALSVVDELKGWSPSGKDAKHFQSRTGIDSMYGLAFLRADSSLISAAISDQGRTVRNIHDGFEQDVPLPIQPSDGPLEEQYSNEAAKESRSVSKMSMDSNADEESASWDVERNHSPSLRSKDGGELGMWDADRNVRRSKSFKSIGSTSSTRSCQFHDVDRAHQQRALERKDTSSLEEDVEEMDIPKWRKWVRHFIESSRAELTFGLAVCSNSVLIGVETDWAARNPSATPPLSFYMLGVFYTTVFTVELILRLLSNGFLFFYDPKDWHWNYFDLVSVTGALIETGFTTAYLAGQSGSKSVSGISQVRLLRILRATRLMRFFRISRVLRFVGALRSLVYSILGTMKSLFWSMILLVLIIYTFAVIFTQAVSSELNEALNLSAHDRDVLRIFWGNVSRSMLTLFTAICDGISWEVAAKPLAVFVQSSVEDAKSDEEHMVQAVLSQKGAYSNLCRNLFRKIDDNGSGSINLNEFSSHYEEVEVQALFEALELEPEDAWSLFKLLDGGQNHAISEAEFIQGCMKCRGQAKRVDMFMFVEHYTYSMQQMLGFLERAQAQLAVISGVDPNDLAVETAPMDSPHNGVAISERMQQRISRRFE